MTAGCCPRRAIDRSSPATVQSELIPPCFSLPVRACCVPLAAWANRLNAASRGVAPASLRSRDGRAAAASGLAARRAGLLPGHRRRQPVALIGELPGKLTEVVHDLRLLNGFRGRDFAVMLGHRVGQLTREGIVFDPLQFPGPLQKLCLSTLWRRLGTPEASRAGTDPS